MRTTLLNPTLLLLAALAGLCLVAVVRRWAGGRPFECYVGTAVRLPVLLAAGALVIPSVGSRLIVGYLAPGAYAEDVLGARAFLAGSDVHAGGRADLQRWLADEPPAADPWTLPGMSACQARAIRQRPQFYTAQAHSPALLLAAAPIVGLAGGRGLYLALAVLSCLGLGLVALVLLYRAGLPARSPAGALVILLLAGWQPVLAGLRQGDAVLIAGALLMLSWRWAGRDQPARAGIAAGLAAAASLPIVLVLPALARHAPRAFAAALTTLALSVAASTAAAGLTIVPDFAETVTLAARTYAQAGANYGLAGRLAGSGAVGSGLLLAAIAAAVVVTATRATTLDRAFAAFSALAVLAAPLAWSQHMVIALPALCVLLVRVRSGGGAALLGWTLLVMAVSLPDPAMARLHHALGTGMVPLVPLGALLALWISHVVPSTTRALPASEPIRAAV